MEMQVFQVLMKGSFMSGVFLVGLVALLIIVIYLSAKLALVDHDVKELQKEMERMHDTAEE